VRTAALGDIIEFTRSGFWGSEKGASEVDARVVRNGDVQASGGIRWDGLPTCGLEATEARAAAMAEGDLLMTTSGYCGQVALVRKRPTELTCATNFVRILRLDRSKVDPTFVFHYMNQPTFRAVLEPFIRGTTMKNLSVGDAMTAIAGPIPPIEEQRRIAGILDSPTTCERSAEPPSPTLIH
jgi:type I restriction enzyme, S subunit